MDVWHRLYVVPIAPEPPKPQLGEWWLTRTNRPSRTRGCMTCGGKIMAHEFKVVYVPSADVEPTFVGKPKVYKEMAYKTDWCYYHIDETCLPPHELQDGSAFVQEVINRDSLVVEIARSPKYMKETLEQYYLDIESAVQKTLATFRLVGHRAEE